MQRRKEKLARQAAQRLREERHRCIAHWRLKYRMTPEQYVELLDRQGCRCAVCQRRFGMNLTPVVDHDHQSNEVRGLLCNGCNGGLGKLGDGALLDAAKSYLENPPFRSLED